MNCVLCARLQVLLLPLQHPSHTIIANAGKMIIEWEYSRVVISVQILSSNFNFMVAIVRQLSFSSDCRSSGSFRWSHTVWLETTACPFERAHQAIELSNVHEFYSILTRRWQWQRCCPKMSEIKSWICWANPTTSCARWEYQLTWRSAQTMNSPHCSCGCTERGAVSVREWRIESFAMPDKGEVHCDCTQFLRLLSNRLGDCRIAIQPEWETVCRHSKSMRTFDGCLTFTRGRQWNFKSGDDDWSIHRSIVV